MRRLVGPQSCIRRVDALGRRARGKPTTGAVHRRRSTQAIRPELVIGALDVLGRGLAAYKAYLKWNRTTWTKDPDTKQRVRRKRPKTEWVEKTLPEIRIVEDATWARVALSMSSLKDGDPRLKNGGVAKYLLSGLLRCDKCGANYVQGNGLSTGAQYGPAPGVQL